MSEEDFWDDPDGLDDSVGYEDEDDFYENFSTSARDYALARGAPLDRRGTSLMWDLTQGGQEPLEDAFDLVEGGFGLPSMSDPDARRQQLAEAIEDDQLDRRDAGDD